MKESKTTPSLADEFREWLVKLRIKFNQIVFEDTPIHKNETGEESGLGNDRQYSESNTAPEVNSTKNAQPSEPVHSPSLYGGVKYRFIALCIDFFLLTVAFIVVLFLLNRFVENFNVQIESDIEIPKIYLILALFIFLTACYFVIFECSNLKTTLGKHIFGLIVTDYNSNKLNFSRSFLRFLGKITSLLIVVLASFQLFVILFEFTYIMTTNRYGRLPTDDLHIIEDEQLRIWFFVITTTITIILALKIGLSAKNQAFHDNIAKTVVAFNRKSEQMETDAIAQPKYAGFLERFVAFLIDILILLFFCGGVVQIYTPIIQEILGWESGSYGLDLIVSLVIFAQNLIVVFLYYTVFVSSDLQGTLGKYVVGLKITDYRGERISFFRAMVRFYANIFSLGLMLIGCLMVLWTRKKQALHDKVARTNVIKVR